MTTCLVGMLSVMVQAAIADKFEKVEVLPLHERIAVVYVVEGHAVHHRKGQKREQEYVVLLPLDTTAATKPEAWTVSCPEDPDFAAGVRPVKIGRKSKGTEFAWMVQGWDPANNRAVNKDPDHVKSHWLYLVLPEPMKPGRKYTFRVEGVKGLETPLTLEYSFERSRSEAVHVNIIGYLPDAPAKYGYVYHWAGDMGSVDFSFLDGKPFKLIDQRRGKAVFTGRVTFRAKADRQETGHVGDTPNGNFQCADVWQCDFSSFSRPGTYVLSVEGVGCSFPFRIDADVYREPFRIACRGLYHNRSGIALKKPYTEFERPAPHNPLITPGFAGKLLYTTLRHIDGGDKSAIEAGIKGPIDVWGWYQDAGDWDSYASHAVVPATLLFAFETAPQNFSDGELNIPESGNGVPDILDEAAWLPRFCYRLRHELLKKGWGTGGIGLRVCGDPFGGDTRPDGTTIGSWEDTHRQWIVSGEDPDSTFRYAAVAAHLAWCLKLAGVSDPEGVDWLAEAREAYAWALKAPGAEKFKDWRCYAAAALYRLTQDESYEAQFERDVADLKRDTELLWDRQFGPWAYCLGGKGKPELQARIREVVLASAELQLITNVERRALRWGGHFYMPMLIGHLTTPWVLSGVVAYALTKDTDPAKAQAFRSGVITTCDYFLGTNSLNQTWVTGLGVRHPREVFHMDAWYNGKPVPHPGIVPYGPWKKSKDLGQGPWDVDWANKTVYPKIDLWPGAERWFDNRNCPLSSEFTIHQNTCYTAATFGWLCAPTGSRRR